MKPAKTESHGPPAIEIPAPHGPIIVLPDGETAATVVFEDPYRRLVYHKSRCGETYLMEQSLTDAMGVSYWHRVEPTSEAGHWTYRHLLELAAFGPGKPGRVQAR